MILQSPSIVIIIVIRCHSQSVAKTVDNRAVFTIVQQFEGILLSIVVEASMAFGDIATGGEMV